MGLLLRALAMVAMLGWGLAGKPAQAYEYEHYALTYYLAVHLGYTERQAFQIASATFAVDWDANTSPMPWGKSDTVLGLAAGSSDERFRQIWRDYHAFVPLGLVLALREEFASKAETEAAYEQFRRTREAELWTMGLRLENIGVFMHYHQDREPHGGWADLFGHGPAVHLPDMPAVDPQAFLRTAQNTVAALQRFHTEVCESYERDFCDRPLRAPDWPRIETVMVRIMNANPVPDIDYQRLLDDLKELSFSFDPVDDAAIQAIQHRSLLRCSVTELCPGTLLQLITNAEGALFGVSEVLENNGLSDSLQTWFTGIPGPDDDPTYRVVVQALSEERLSRAGEWSEWDARLLREFTGLQLDMPVRWFQFSHLPDGRVINARQSYAIEDRRYNVTPAIPEVTIEESVGPGGAPLFRVSLEVTVALENRALIDDGIFVLTSELSAPRPAYGQADIALARQLPAVVALDTNVDGGITFEYGILGDGEEMTLAFETTYSADDWAGQGESWGLLIHAYGLPTLQMEVPVQLPGARPICNSLVDNGGNEGGRYEIDMDGFVGTAGFSWDMFDVRDGMLVTIGGREYSTGCVSDTGTFEVDVRAGDRIAVVQIVPNCDHTSSTAWNFEFQCPLTSEVTTNGQGAPLEERPDPDSTAMGPGMDDQLTPDFNIPTAFGQDVWPAPFPPDAIELTGWTVDETDDNNNFGTATPIRLGDDVHATIEPRGDGDMYAVTIAKQGELTVRFTDVPPELNIAFRVLTPGGSQVVGWQTAPSSGAAFEGWVDIATGGDYVIEVRDGSSDAATFAPYAMQTTFIPTADTGEPNNDIGTATPLDWNTEIGANILPRGDADHYLVSAVRMGQVTVSFTAAPPGVNLFFRVLTPGGSQVSGWQGTDVAGELYVGQLDLPAPGDYIIEVRDGSSDARSSGPYGMVASLDPAFDGAEPNDTIATATALPFDTQVWANISPRGDADHYLVSLPHQGELTVAFNASPDNVDLYFRVLTPGGSQIWGWQGASVAGETVSNWADIAAPGDYIIEVRDGSSDARSNAPYGMFAHFEPTADGAEPNNDIESATDLALGVLVAANILPRGDADHYLVNLPHQGELTVTFNASPDNIDLYFRVLTPGGRQVWGWQGASVAGETVSHWADIAMPGNYIIEVRDGSSDARSIQPYNIQATLVSTADTGIEPNDALEQATPIVAAMPIVGSILPRGDADLYLFEATGADQRFSLLSSPPTLDLYFRVLTMGGSQAIGWQGAAVAGALFESEISGLDPGPHIIEVRDGASDARSTEDYVFVLSAP